MHHAFNKQKMNNIHFIMHSFRQMFTRILK